MKKFLFISFLFLTNFVKAQHAPFNPRCKEEVAFYSQVVAYSGSLTCTERGAVNVLATQLLNQSLFNAFYNFYPMVGGTINSCKFNLITPQTYSITFVNTVAADFTSAGFDGNGTNSYGNMNITPSTTFTLNNTAMHYSAITITVTGSPFDMGGQTANANRMGVIFAGNSQGSTCYQYNTTAAQGLLTSATGSVTMNISSMFTLTRTSATSHEVYQNNSLLASNTTSGGTLTTAVMYLNAFNNNGTASNFLTRTCRMAGVSRGLSSTEVAALYNIDLKVQQFLGR